MLLDIRARASYQLPVQTFVLLMVEPAIDGPCHHVQDASLQTSSTQNSELWNDLYGNPVRRLMAPQGEFNFDYSAQIEVQPNTVLPPDAPELDPPDIPAECLIYTVPSRYCQSDKLQRLAQSEFGAMTPGGSRVGTIAKWIRERVEYQYGTTDAMTDAFDTATSRVGVCRDFAHLMISFCRALGVPARYVSGYCLDLEPPDFHAWVQVYVGDAWHNVDATFGGVREALVPIAYGRDAADVPMTTLFGNSTLNSQTVEVSKQETRETGDEENRGSSSE